jgi:O-acetyl-ADP-ribose deacetylase (regulator of RNase III)
MDRCRFCGLPPPWALERRADSDGSNIQPWRAGEHVNAPATALYRNPMEGGIWVIEGDITRIAVEAIVSNDDVDGQMWAQVSRAIKSAAGNDVERQARENRPHQLGQAWWTKPGALKLKGIIHVAAVGRHGESSLKTIEECLANAIELAKEEKCRSLGIPAIGNNPASTTPQAWYTHFADAALGQLARRRTPPSQPLDIVLVLYESPDFAETLRSLQQAIWDSWVKLGDQRVGEPAVYLESRWRRLTGRPRKPALDPEEELIDLLYRWHRLERSINELPVIELDLLGGSEGRRIAFSSRAEALERAGELARRADVDSLAGQKTRAAHTLLRMLSGGDMPFQEYLEGTLGIAPRAIAQKTIESQHKCVTRLLEEAGYPHTGAGVQQMKTDTAISEREMRAEFSAALAAQLKALRSVTGVDPESVAEIKFIAPESHWGNWTEPDPAQRGGPLEINAGQVPPCWRGQGELQALHEVAGHMCQTLMWRKRIEDGELTRAAGILTSFGPEAFCLEGLAQTLSWLVAENPLSADGQRAAEMSHLGVLVWANIHLMLQQGGPVEAALAYAREHSPGYMSEEAAQEQVRRTLEDPALGAQGYVYGASAHAFRTAARRLDGNGRSSLLRELYRRPVLAQDLQQDAEARATPRSLRDSDPEGSRSPASRQL